MYNYLGGENILSPPPPPHFSYWVGRRPSSPPNTPNPPAFYASVCKTLVFLKGMIFFCVCRMPNYLLYKTAHQNKCSRGRVVKAIA